MKTLVCQDCVQFSASLSLSPGTSLFFSYSSCLFLTSSWSVSPLDLPPFFAHAFSGALQGCKSQQVCLQRVSTHLANTEESSLLPLHSSKCPGLCRYISLGGEGTVIRLEVVGRETMWQRSMSTECVGQRQGRTGTSIGKNQGQGSNMSGASKV